MIFSRSSQYAIQALVLMATRPPGSFVMCREIAGHLDLPLPYLSKLMLQFTRAGVVESSRGRLGGYRLGRGAESLNLKEILEIIGGERATTECLLGLKACSDETACAMHCQWRPVKQVLFQLLEEQSVGQLAEQVKSGRCQLGELSLSRFVPQ